MFFFSRRLGFFAPPFLGGKDALLFFSIFASTAGPSWVPGGCGGLRPRSGYFLVAFFLPATVFFGPLRVRALVWVRWPRTGSPRRWRMPWEEPISILRLMSCWTSRRRAPSTL